MNDLPTLRRELIGAFGVIFAGALFVAAVGIILVVPRLSPLAAGTYVATLLLADLAVFFWLGSRMLRRRLTAPLDALVSSVEAMSAGELETRLPDLDSQELQRLNAATQQMAARLLADQHTLAENIRSLDETNRLLTEARDEMIRTEKMASVGRLGAGIAHEVGNPLGAIMGYLALIARQEEGPRRDMVLAAEKEASRIDRIIRGLLDYSRPRDAVVQRVDVTAVLRDTIDLVVTQGHFSGVELDYAPAAGEELLVRGDPYQLQQVMVNLLVNAADAVSEQRERRISIMASSRPALPAPEHRPAKRRDDPEGVDYSHRRRLPPSQRWPMGDPESESGAVVEIVVADNGPGLPQDLVDKVFEPFVTTKEPGKGTGLGLAVCARLVAGMGGTIHAGNGAESGAEFHVVLPTLPELAG
jgi:two-component system, NtrC family, sensor kinase